MFLFLFFVFFRALILHGLHHPYTTIITYVIVTAHSCGGMLRVLHFSAFLLGLCIICVRACDLIVLMMHTVHVCEKFYEVMKAITFVLLLPQVQ